MFDNNDEAQKITARLDDVSALLYVPPTSAIPMVPTVLAGTMPRTPVPAIVGKDGDDGLYVIAFDAPEARDAAFQAVETWFESACEKTGLMVNGKFTNYQQIMRPTIRHWRYYREANQDDIAISLRFGASLPDVAQALGWDIDGDAIIRPGYYADDGNAILYYPDAETGDEAAETYVEDGDWGEPESTEWIHVRAWRAGYRIEDGALEEIEIDDETYSIEIDTPEPDCDDDSDEHDWCSPFSVVGGIKENPGVWGHGGGVKITEVCRHCGTYRDTDTWATNRSDGTQGHTTIAYREPDEESTAWAEMED